MIVVAILASCAIGFVFYMLTGVEMIAWLAGASAAIVAVPVAVILDLIRGAAEYSQHRSDAREKASSTRIARAIAKVKRSTVHDASVIDNRQVHLHLHAHNAKGELNGKGKEDR